MANILTSLTSAKIPEMFSIFVNILEQQEMIKVFTSKAWKMFFQIQNKFERGVVIQLFCLYKFQL